MKILVTAKYISGVSYEGGSSRFMRTVINGLRSIGHDVVDTTEPEEYEDTQFDMIICSHHLKRLYRMNTHDAKIVAISHGLIEDEKFSDGADRYISVSEETMRKHLHDGFGSEIVGQPIEIHDYVKPNEELKNILVIRREPVADDPFSFLEKKYNLRYSALEKPIEEQIAWADLCITLGRGALEAMAQGKLVLVADNRHYIGAYGDGYVTKHNVEEIARCNFSGRRYKQTVTKEWIEKQLAKYHIDDSYDLYDYVSKKHNVFRVLKQYLRPFFSKKIMFGSLVNDYTRFDMVLLQSEIEGDIDYIKMPETACKGLNKLLSIIEEKGGDVAVLAHQDMFFRKGWLDQLRLQIAKLPDSWVVAGIIGKDMDGRICGRIHDMRMPLHFATEHDFPHPASCFDECCIIVNMSKGFRFDEDLPGFHLYGTLCVLQAWEMGGTAWILNAFAEHYCLRPFTWFPDKEFESCYKWLHEKFPNAKKIDTTAIGGDSEEEYVKRKREKMKKFGISDERLIRC